MRIQLVIALVLLATPLASGAAIRTDDVTQSGFLTDTLRGEAPAGEYIDPVTHIVYALRDGTLVPIGASLPALGYVVSDASARGEPQLCDIQCNSLPSRFTATCTEPLCVAWKVSLAGAHSLLVKAIVRPCDGYEYEYILADKSLVPGDLVTESAGVHGFQIPVWNGYESFAGHIIVEIYVNGRLESRDSALYTTDDPRTMMEVVGDFLDRTAVGGTFAGVDSGQYATADNPMLP